MEDEPNTSNVPNTSNELITKDQIQILNDILRFYYKDESNIECCEITMYCHINSIDILDELAIYNHLYGVQENICFHNERKSSKSTKSPTSPKRRMSELSNSIMNIENMLYEPSISTTTPTSTTRSRSISTDDELSF